MRGGYAVKPQNVIDHDHYFAYLDENGVPLDLEDDITGRYDACLTRDDGAGVWSPASGRWWPTETYEKAKMQAEHMAATFAKMHPLKA